MKVNAFDDMSSTSLTRSTKISHYSSISHMIYMNMETLEAYTTSNAISMHKTPKDEYESISNQNRVHEDQNITSIALASVKSLMCHSPYL